MGFSHSLVATRGIPKAQLLEQLGLTETDETGDVDIPAFGHGLGELPGGWLLVACNDFDLPRNAPLAVISEGGEVICAAIEEHVMVSEAALFRQGTQVWRVTHNSERGVYDLQIEGSPPENLAKLRDEARAEQEREGGEKAGVDITFDVPPKLAASICGFEFGISEGDFVRLLPIGAARKADTPPARGGGFFSRLFGR